MFNLHVTKNNKGKELPYNFTPKLFVMQISILHPENIIQQHVSKQET